MFTLKGEGAELADAAFTARRNTYGDSDLVPTKEDMAEAGLALWPHTYQGNPEDDYEAFTQLHEWVKVQGRPLLEASILIPSEQISMIGAARWADQAFPRFIISHTYAAALMATAVTEEVLEDVRPPYRAFMIDVPDGLLTVWNSHRQVFSKIRWILVQQIVKTTGERVWQYIAHADPAICVWRHGVDTRGLCEPDLPDNNWEGCSFMAPKDDRDDRIAALIGRLIVGICLSFLDPSNSKPTSRHSNKTDPSSLKPTDIRTFKLGRPLSVDCRKGIEDYVNGARGGIPSVRTLVRGHWKKQPHGPQSSLRKVIWREPYWRGPLDGPTLVRPTVMGRDEDTQAGTAAEGMVRPGRVHGVR